MSRAALSVATLCAANLAGCYRHVVEVRGPGAASYDVYEPHYKPEEERQIADFFGGLFGQNKDDKKR